ncbi:MAG: hypothetical protein KBG84_11155 [Planctomycetes bacterium]|nr:hypothetical protein [Planctomycetota bacterium]CAG0987807.1 hypothetical protein PLCT2_02288 [Planctomycetaceae bacterium]
MLAMEAADILGHILKAAAIGFGVVMVLFIIRSIKKSKMDSQGKGSSGPEHKP